VHFRADFQPIADKVLVVEAPGAHPCRLDKISYRNLRPGVRLGPGGRPHAVY
jgi:microcystin degradation protein MlrC